MEKIRISASLSVERRTIGVAHDERDIQLKLDVFWETEEQSHVVLAGLRG
jgi:hypothetical protein